MVCVSSLHPSQRCILSILVKNMYTDMCPEHLGAETCTIETENLRSLERIVHMMVRGMCDVSLKDKKLYGDLYSLLGIPCMADVVRLDRLRLL